MEKNVDRIIIKGDRVHNLKNIDVEVPLNKLVAIAGVSGSGKSSLALGTLYAEGSSRYLEALSTYTRRRIKGTSRPNVDSIKHVPAALALHQRPSIPGVRSTFGTASELLNSLRLMFSRLSSHRCPNGHLQAPSMNVSLMKPYVCPICGEKFYGPGAEDLAFNSRGACPTCHGTGIARTVDESTLVPDENKTIDEGAVVVWGSLIWKLMIDVAREMGVRTNVPFKDLTPKEKEIVYHGPMIKKHIHYFNEKSQQEGELDFTYYSAVNTVLNALSKVKDEKGMKRVSKYLKEGVCPTCHGTRLSKEANSSVLNGKALGEASAMTLDDLLIWIKEIPDTLPKEMQDMAEAIIRSFDENAKRLIDLGLGYISLDRASSTLSTGERQRVQLARAVRNETTGVLYVLDEPSIGLHPSNIDGLLEVVDSLIKDGNSVVLVDHDVRVIEKADYIIEMGPYAGKNGGEVIAKGTVDEIIKNKDSKIAGFIDESIDTKTRKLCKKDELFKLGTIEMNTNKIHTVKELHVKIPKGRLTTITGVSGSGKTTMILECLIPGVNAYINKTKMPESVKDIKLDGINRINLIDSTPIGINVRSTVSTYTGILDDLRKLFAGLNISKKRKLNAGDFSYNTGKLRCDTCNGTGEVNLDVQFLPDVVIKCPDCHGDRYSSKVNDIYYEADGEKYNIKDIMKMTVTEARDIFKDEKRIINKLDTLIGLGLGYLTLGEDTPSLSGGEAQRLKLASEIGKMQNDTIFVFDEPSIGLHPLDVQVLLKIFDRLVANGATLIVIEHDLDIIKNSDYIIDMGPGGGNKGGTIVACGTPDDIKNNPKSLTGKYL